MVTLRLKPKRGGFLRPFGCGWFVREFLLGRGPNGSQVIDSDVGAPQADIFHHYKLALMTSTVLDRAVRTEEKRARREKRPINPDNIDRFAERHLARMTYKAQGCRYTFAKNYLLNSGDNFSRQKILGHSSLASVRIYLNLFASDIKMQYRQFSPVDNMVENPDLYPFLRATDKK